MISIPPRNELKTAEKSYVCRRGECDCDSLQPDVLLYVSTRKIKQHVRRQYRRYALLGHECCRMQMSIPHQTECGWQESRQEQGKTGREGMLSGTVHGVDYYDT